VQYEFTKLTRDVVGAIVPSGEEVSLPEGMEVRITQALGGSYTIIAQNGQMLRIAGQDADALGKESLPPIPVEMDGKPRTIEDQAWDWLKTVFDPEIPVNIVELGLVYDCKVVAIDQEKSRVEIQMTLTAPGCGMGDVLKVEAESKLKRIPGVTEAKVAVVWDPPWDRSKMTEAARLHLGMM
jgi:probable FeS assembly SUF system protein SufT